VADVRVDQNSFVQGQIDARVQTRTDWDNYYKSAKEITNCLVIPQGGVQNRWGTQYVDTITATNPLYAEISTFVYNDNIVYLLLWQAKTLRIYIENICVNVAAATATQYFQEDIPTLRFTQVETRLIISTGNYAVQQLVRSADGAQAISAINAVIPNTLTATTGYGAGLVLPVQFATTGALPTTSPQIFAQRDYFIRTVNATDFQIFSTTADAYNQVNAYAITVLGNNSTVNVQNTWTISNVVFKFYPAYDFNGGYSGAGFTFTPSAVTGAINITASSPIFSAAFVGGLFQGNGGTARLLTLTSTTIMTAVTVEDFTNTNAIAGNVSFLGEPAWSAIRGYTTSATFFQNRLVLAGTAALPNGQWLSVINDPYNFDDSQTLADDSISWYPSSGNMTTVQSMTSTRSLLIHTNAGNFSTPVQNEAPVTPTTYVLTEQNKFAVGSLQPVFIDNQIFFIDKSGNNVINMIWEFSQSSYVTNSISIKASSLIRNPVDMAAFAEPISVDGFYVLFVNSDGTICVLQTLHEEGITAFSITNTCNSIASDQISTITSTSASYVKVNTGQNRCWFLVNRQVPVAIGATAISAANQMTNVFTAAGHGMTVGAVTMVTFTTSGVLPTTVPQIVINNYYFAIALDANTFQIYGSGSDAANLANVYTISALGVTSNIVPWPLAGQIWIEEVDFDYYTDASTTFNSSVATTTVTGLNYLNGQVVQVVADGYVLQNKTVVGGQITLENPSNVIKVGLPFTSTLVPLPPVLIQQSGMLYQQKHIRNLYISYYNTIGATIQGFGIPVVNMQQIVIGALPEPETGVFEYTLMQGWGGANPDPIMVTQSAPLPMTILALSYVLDI
jgi:hypothetical protein